MLAMSGLPSDSFLPTGGMHFSPNPNEHSLHQVYSTTTTTSATHLNGRSSTSPLSLPRALDQLSYLDELASLHTPSGRHHSPASHPRHNRPDTLSPAGHQITSGIVSPSSLALGNPSPSTSPERASIPALAQQLKRVVLQNRRLLENWEAERAHLEANRARAEEVYKEEREIMDEERLMWVEEKTRLEIDLLEWKKRAEIAEAQRDIALKEVIGLRNQPEAHHKVVVNSHAERSSNSSSGTPATTESGGSGSPGDRQAPGLLKTPIGAVSPFPGRGMTMPESRPFEPLDPRMQCASPPTTHENVEKEQVPSVYISEVIPGLEGIRVKKPALEKPTFSFTEEESSTTDSKTSPSPPQDGSPKLVHRSNSAKMTKQALDAPAFSRLTMHAGHTPNHSISLSRLQTVESTRAANTADSSGTATPTGDTESGLGIDQPTQDEPEEGQDDEAPLDHMDPSDGDKPLEGPLQLRNRPASDEPFLRRLSDKLEDSIRSNDVIPTVLRSIGSVSPPSQSPPEQAPDVATGEDGDVKESSPSVDDDKGDIEADIPLKCKQFSSQIYTVSCHIQRS